MTQQYHLELIIRAASNEKTHLLELLLSTVANHACTIKDSYFKAVGNEETLFLHVAGNWHNVPKLQETLTELAKHDSLNISFGQSQEPNGFLSEFVPYLVNIVSSQKVDAPSQVVQFFAHFNIRIQEMAINSFAPQRTKTPMQVINLVILLPVDTNITHVREQFALMCEELNLDAVLEVERN